MAVKYPYELINTLISSLSLNRTNELSKAVEIPISAEVKVVEPGFPKLQVNLRVKSPEDAPLSFNIEVIGLFDYVGEKAEYDLDLNKEFVNEKAIHLLWVYISQMVKLLTSQMGTNPLQIRYPISFSPTEDKEKTTKP